MSQANACAFGHAAENGHCPGITKREWFAGLALQGLLAAETGEFYFLKTTERTREEVISDQAYALADAMLRAQEPRP